MPKSQPSDGLHFLLNPSNVDHWGLKPLAQWKVLNISTSSSCLGRVNVYHWLEFPFSFDA